MPLRGRYWQNFNLTYLHQFWRYEHDRKCVRKLKHHTFRYWKNIFGFRPLFVTQNGIYKLHNAFFSDFVPKNGSFLENTTFSKWPIVTDEVQNVVSRMEPDVFNQLVHTHVVIGSLSCSCQIGRKLNFTLNDLSCQMLTLALVFLRNQYAWFKHRSV